MSNDKKQNSDKPNIPVNADIFEVNATIQNVDLRKENEELKRQLAEQQAKNTNPENVGLSAPLGAVSQIQQSTKGKQHAFRVVQMKAEPGKGPIPVADAIVNAVDESEAIRLFCVCIFEDGKAIPRNLPLDPSRFTFEALPVDRNDRHADSRAKYEERGVPANMLPAFAR